MTYGYGLLPCGCRLGRCGCNDNLGQVGIDNLGDPTIGVGDGLAIDLVTGDVVVEIGDTGLGIDLG